MSDTSPVTADFVTIDDILPAATLDKVAHLIEHLRGKPLPRPTGYHVLVLQYVRPDTIKTAGGLQLYLADRTRKEDELQGRVGLVLALGPEAYADPARYPRGAWVKPGDWVMWPPLETAATRFSYARATLAELPDDRIINVLPGPELAHG